MSVITAVLRKTGRDWDSFNKYLGVYGFHKEEDSDRWGHLYTKVVDNNRLSKNKVNKNSCNVYQQNLNTLMNFLPMELVEKILDYGTYTSPMLNIYKEMIMRCGETINLKLLTDKRYHPPNISNREESDYLHGKLYETQGFNERWTIGFIYDWDYSEKLVKRYNGNELIKQIDTKKNIERLLLYIIKEYNKYKKHDENEYGFKKLEKIGLTPQDILMDLKQTIGVEWDFISQLIYNVFLPLTMKTNYTLYPNHILEYIERRRLKEDAFGRRLDLREQDKLYFKYISPIHFHKIDFKDCLKCEVIELIQNDFNLNKIPIKIMKSWKKEKIIKIWVQEGREIFLKEHNKKYKKVLKELKSYCKNPSNFTTTNIYFEV